MQYSVSVRLSLQYDDVTLYGHIKTAEQRTIIHEYEVGTLAVDGWAVTFGTAGTNFMSFDVALCRVKPSVIPELSMGWVNPRVELGWVGSRFFIFGGLGWVVGPKRQKHKN